MKCLTWNSVWLYTLYTNSARYYSLFSFTDKQKDSNCD